MHALPRQALWLITTILLIGALPAPADTIPRDYAACLADALERAADTATVGELRQRCAREAAKPAVSPEAATAADSTPETTTAPPPSAVGERLALEHSLVTKPWVITPHKPNYLLPITHNRHADYSRYIDDNGAENYHDAEAKFQISFKFPVTRNLLGSDADLYFAYTNQSYWQLYARDVSSPFRETNHEPELFVSLPNDYSLFGWRNSLLLFGFSHQSNGRSAPLSRSWNRLYAVAVLDRGRWAMALRPWYRIPESKKDDPLDSSGDDNPDIHRYMGYGELLLAYRRKDQVLSMMLRNNLMSDNRGAVELNYSFPLTKKVKGFVQYFNGYGESLIDYDEHSHRIGLGIAISDWL